jgi:hypothetical protein
MLHAPIEKKKKERKGNDKREQKEHDPQKKAERRCGKIK